MGVGDGRSDSLLSFAFRFPFSLSVPFANRFVSCPSPFHKILSPRFLLISLHVLPCLYRVLLPPDIEAPRRAARVSLWNASINLRNVNRLNYNDVRGARDNYVIYGTIDSSGKEIRTVGLFAARPIYGVNLR